MPTLVLLPHGESDWNKKNLFIGWADVDLTEAGVKEARRAGSLLQAEKLGVDRCFTSVLKRAVKILFFALEEMDLVWLPVEKTWRRNERHYGALHGLNRIVARLYGRAGMTAVP